MALSLTHTVVRTLEWKAVATSQSRSPVRAWEELEREPMKTRLTALNKSGCLSQTSAGDFDDRVTVQSLLL